MCIFPIQNYILLRRDVKLDVQVNNVENQVKLVEVNFNFESIEGLSRHFDVEFVFEKL